MELDYKRIDLLVSVATLYYEHGYNQNQIAQKLGLSRPYISKLIAEARERGIVTIQIHDPAGVETPLERDLRQRFGLRKVIVVPQTPEAPLTKVGQAAARYLNSIVSAGDIVGVGWGATMYTAARSAALRRDLSDVTVVQLCGGISNLERSIYANEIPKLFADAFSGTPYILPLPAIVDDSEVKRSILTDHNIGRVMEVAARANIAMFTLGKSAADSALTHAGYLADSQLKRLDEAGAVGDICCHFIDEHGRLCDPELDARTIGLPPEELRRKEHRIAVAIGMSKVRSICGALRGGYATELITNEDTAAAVMRRLDEIDA
ncbi:MAG: sugar-binding transcriptional regulator [Oscillospiraceae bacterium]|nr:sugar-binding transcriptional regulator [Oscillospiraceae bacterium]